MNTLKRAMSFAIAVMLIFCLTACGNAGSKKEPAEQLDLVALNELNYSNHLAVEEKYYNKRYRVTTEIDGIYSTSITAGHYISCTHIGGGKEYFDFDLKYRKDQKDIVLNFKVGQRITFEGTLISVAELSPAKFEDVVFIVDQEEDLDTSEFYNQANTALENGDKTKAAMLFGKAVGYKDAKEKSLELWHQITVHNTIGTGYSHAVALKEDGKVVAVGKNKRGQCDVGKWNNIVAVAVTDDHTVGLKADGKVVATGDNNWGQCEVGEWTDIIAIATGSYQTIGLKDDGTVVAAGYNVEGECNVGDWTDIVAIAAGYHTVGLKADGTVVATGANSYGECNVDGWTDVVAVSAGGHCTVALKADGTVVATGINSYGQCNVLDWKNITAVSTSGTHTVGVNQSGVAVAVGYYKFKNQCDVSNWSEIVSVATRTGHTIGLKADGTVVTVGDKDDYDQRDVSGWKNIKIPDTLK